MVPLFWEPADEGEYTGYFTIVYEDEAKTGVTGTVVKSDTFKFAVRTSTNIVLAGVSIGILAIACILFVLFMRRRSKLHTDIH